MRDLSRNEGAKSKTVHRSERQYLIIRGVEILDEFIDCADRL